MTVIYQDQDRFYFGTLQSTVSVATVMNIVHQLLVKQKGNGKLYWGGICERQTRFEYQARILRGILKRVDTNFHTNSDLIPGKREQQRTS